MVSHILRMPRVRVSHEKYEHALIVQLEGTRRQSLPISQLAQLPFVGRYINLAIWPQVMGAVLGLFVGLLGLTAGLYWFYGVLPFAAAGGIVLGCPLGTAMGWRAGAALRPGPLWAIRKSPTGVLTPVIPEPLIQDAAENAPRMEVRAETLFYAAKNPHARMYYRTKQTKWRGLQYGALIVLAISMGGLLFLFVMASNEDKPSQGGVDENVPTTQQP